MALEAKWSFAGRGAGQIQGFNVAGLQWFADDPVGKVVREICQNSIDAAINSDEPVRVAMALREVNSASIIQLAGLPTYLDAALDAASKQNQEDAKSYWSNAKHLMNQQKIRMLEFHDFKTKGLTGPTDYSIENAGTPWIGLVMASGVNVASNDAAGGSFGIGKSAPFVLSGIRSVFYYTHEVVGNERRFIGSSVLQSIDVPSVHPEEPARQGFGNFGMVESGSFVRPLLNDEIPKWVAEGRERYGTGSGTSVIVPGIPATLTAKEFANKAVVATIANLYASVKFGILEVEIESDLRILIDKSNVDSLLTDVIAGKYGAPSEFTMDQLSSAITVRDGVSSEMHIPRFGDVKLYLRTGGDTVGQNVGIARTNGQLITRRPPSLLSFGHLGLQPFDLFVYVNHEGAAKTIRAFEPPSHDSLVLDKAPDLRARYDALVAKIKEYLKVEVGIRVAGKRRIGELNDVFGLAKFGDKQSEQVNESVKSIRISEGTRSKSKTIWGKKPTTTPPTPPVPTPPPTGSSTRTRIDPVANFGEEIAVSNVAEDPTIQFRITDVDFSNSTKVPRAKVWFNFPTTGASQEIELYVVGDSQNARIPIRSVGSKSWSWSVEVKPTSAERRFLHLEVGSLSFIGATVAALLVSKGQVSDVSNENEEED